MIYCEQYEHTVELFKEILGIQLSSKYCDMPHMSYIIEFIKNVIVSDILTM